MEKKLYIKNVIWLFADKGINIFCSLIIGIWVARYLGPTDYGVLNYAIAFAAFFSFLSKLGLDQIVVRELSKRPNDKNEIIGTAFIMKLYGGILAVILIVLSLLLIDINDKVLLVTTFFISLSYIAQSLDVIDYYYQAKVLSKYIVLCKNFALLLTALLQIIFLLKKLNVEYFALAAFINVVLASMFMLLVYIKKEKNLLHWTYNKKFAKKLLVYSWPLMISGFLVMIHMRIDQMMINAFLNKTELGIYSVAVKLVELWYIVPTVLVSTLMPYFVNIRENNNKLYYSRLTQFYSIMFWLGAIVGIGAVLFGQQIILILYGDAYRNAYTALVFNVWAIIFVAQALSQGIWLISENLQKYRLYNNVFAVIINIGLNLILIPKMGISGAALATFLTQFLGTWIFPLFFKQIRESTLLLMRSVNPVNLFLGNKKNSGL